MTTNPFPPQAYTRETLVKAYQWLQNQNTQVKELATTPDLLISLYVKAKTQGEDFLERPSLKTFKSELKSLAGMMGEFETHDTPPAPNGPGLGAQTKDSSVASSTRLSSSTASTTANTPNSSALGPPLQPASTGTSSSLNTTPPAPQTSPPIASTSVTLATTPASIAGPLQLDPRSLLILQEVKISLNLSSESEALRLLISMGHNRLKSL